MRTLPTLFSLLLALPIWAGEYTNYVQLFSFQGTNGANPYAGLIEGSDGRLYGVTASGGCTNTAFPGGMGVVFGLGKDGAAFTVLHAFSTNSDDGQTPLGRLIEGSDGALYGTTANGGALGKGTIFKVSKDGSNYRVLRSLMGGTNDGVSPHAGLLRASDGKLYGTAWSEIWLGGVWLGGGPGLVFRINEDGSDYSALTWLTNNYGLVVVKPTDALIERTNGLLYGVSRAGQNTVWDQYTQGAIFWVGKDGTGFGATIGFFYANLGIPPSFPNGPLLDPGDGFLYFTTFFVGGVFRSPFGPTYDFEALAPLGGATAGPRGGLTQGPDGRLYGTTTGSTIVNNGAVFALNTEGTNFSALKFFTAPKDGATPQGCLLLASDEGFYGITAGGGSGGAGTIFALFPNPRSWLKPPALQTDKTLQLQAVATADTPFRLQFTPTLIKPLWQDLITNISTTLGALEFTNTPMSTADGYYRLASP